MPSVFPYAEGFVFYFDIKYKKVKIYLYIYGVNCKFFIS